MSNLFKFVEENYIFFKTVIEDNQIIGFRSKIFLNYRDYLEGILINTIDNPDKDPTIDRFYFVYVASAAMGMVISWINQGLKPSRDYIIKEFISIIYNRPHDLILGKNSFKYIKIKELKETDQRILRTKKSLSNSLIQLMKYNKYNEITVNDIVEYAQYNRSTFYFHYKNKDDLFHETVSDQVNGMVKSIRNICCVHPGHLCKEKTPLINFFAYIYENSELLEIINANNQVPGFYNRIYTGLVNLFTEELEGRFEYDINIYANYLSSAMLGVISLWLSEELKYSPRFMAKLFTDSLNNLPIKNKDKFEINNRC